MQSSPLHDAGRNAESHSDQTHPLGQLTATVSYPNLGPGVSAQPAGASSQVFLLQKQEFRFGQPAADKQGSTLSARQPGKVK